MTNWRWKASSSSLWPLSAKNGSSTHFAIFTIRWRSLRRSFSVTLVEKYVFTLWILRWKFLGRLVGRQTSWSELHSLFVAFGYGSEGTWRNHEAVPSRRKVISILLKNAAKKSIRSCIRIYMSLRKDARLARVMLYFSVWSKLRSNNFFKRFWERGSSEPANIYSYAKKVICLKPIKLVLWLNYEMTCNARFKIINRT